MKAIHPLACVAVSLTIGIWIFAGFTYVHYREAVADSIAARCGEKVAE